MDEAIQKRLSELGVSTSEDEKCETSEDNNVLNIIVNKVSVINEDNIVIGYVDNFRAVEIPGGSKWETVIVTDDKRFDMDTNTRRLKCNNTWLGDIYKFQTRKNALGEDVSVVITIRYFLDPTEENQVNLMFAAGDIDEKRRVYRLERLRNNG